VSVTLAEPEVALGAHPGPFTIDDIFALPEDGMRHELLDGSIIVSPAPGGPHQVAAARLVRILADAIQDDAEAVETLNVKVPDGMFIPDVLVIRAAAAYAGGRLLDPADLLMAVEITSPSSRTMDPRVKPAAYAKAGIPVYWRVELDGPDAPVVIVHERKGDEYVEVCRVCDGEVRVIDRPYPVRVEPAALVGPRRIPQEGVNAPDTG
jgi:Uma2 family endonuclease